MLLLVPAVGKQSMFDRELPRGYCWLSMTLAESVATGSEFTLGFWGAQGGVGVGRGGGVTD